MTNIEIWLMLLLGYIAFVITVASGVGIAMKYYQLSSTQDK